MYGICDHHGCKDQAKFRPTIQVTARPPKSCVVRRPDAAPIGDNLFHQAVDGPERYVVEYGMLMEFCSYHTDFFQWTKFVDEACWSAIENQLRQIGMAPPSKDEVTVKWEEAAGPDGLSDEGRKQRDVAHGVALAK